MYMDITRRSSKRQPHHSVKGNQAAASNSSLTLKYTEINKTSIDNSIVFPEAYRSPVLTQLRTGPKPKKFQFSVPSQVITYSIQPCNLKSFIYLIFLSQTSQDFNWCIFVKKREGEKAISALFSTLFSLFTIVIYFLLSVG